MQRGLKECNVSEIDKLGQFLSTLTCGELIAKRVRADLMADPDTKNLLKDRPVTPNLCSWQTCSPCQQPQLRLVGAEDSQ